MFVQQAYRTAAFISYGKHSKEFQNEDMAVDLTDKQCVVTGANQGIGFASAEALAASANGLPVERKRVESGGGDQGQNRKLKCLAGGCEYNTLSVTSNPAFSMLRCSGHNAKSGFNADLSPFDWIVRKAVCDLSSLQQIKEFASKYASSGKPLHILVNNAGSMTNERTTNADGLEMNFAVNVAGVYALTELLMTALKRASPDACVISVASGGMYTESLTENLQYEDKKKIDGTAQYARNKRVQVALTEDWAAKHKGSVGFYSMHPGWVDTGGVQKSMPGFYAKFQASLRSLDEGADTIAWLSLQPKTKLQSGEFYFDRKVAPKHLAGCGTQYSPALVATVVSKVQSLCGLT